MTAAFCSDRVIFATVGRSNSNSPTVTDRRYRTWLIRFAWFTTVVTLFLICSGGMVTSKGVGLAVPDWPTTFGYNMFLFPVSKWIGGVFFFKPPRLVSVGGCVFCRFLLVFYVGGADVEHVRA